MSTKGGGVVIKQGFYIYCLNFAVHATVPPLATPLAQVAGARYFPSGATLGTR